MRYILSPANRGVLAQFARSDNLMAFDYDGTLAPIVRDPAKAHLRPRTRRLLRSLARIYPCTIISGRSRADVLRRLAGTGIRNVIGNHGAEPELAEKPPITRKIAAWKIVLEPVLQGMPGVFLEDKKLSLAVHYRNARKKNDVRLAIMEAAQTLQGARLVPSKQALNVTVDGVPTKGEALAKERARLRCATALFVGDDATDEDAFALAHPDRLLTIRIGARRGSRAAYYLKNQAEIDDLLRLLLETRA
jgi:trehalose 6-phosphate phosphatase